MNSQTLVHKQHPLVDSLLQAVQKKGICYASVGVIKDDVIYSAFSHPLWQEYYIENSLHLNDPSFQAAIKLLEIPILWDSVTLYTSEAIAVMNNRCEAVGAIGGVTVCFAADKKKLLLTLGTSVKNDLIGTISNALTSLDTHEILCSRLRSL